MAVPILIATASSGFGELIRKTLEDAGSYQPFLATDQGEFLQHAQRSDLVLAILDSNLEGFSLPEMIQVMRAAHPGIKLIVIPPRDTSQREVVYALPVDGYLNKPFYLPDLLSIINNALQGLQGISQASAEQISHRRTAQTHPEQEQAQSESGWHSDVSRAAQHLTRLSFEVSAQAALLIRDGQLWAYSGQLPQEAASEMAQVVIQDREQSLPYNTTSGDLARFIKLDTTGVEIMLYATRLDEEMILALAFDAQTPFSRIRAQAGRLARALSSPDFPEGRLPPIPGKSTSRADVSQEEAEEADQEPELHIPGMFPEGFIPPPTSTPRQTGAQAEVHPVVKPGSRAPEQTPPASREAAWTFEQKPAARSEPAPSLQQVPIAKIPPATSPVAGPTPPTAIVFPTDEIQASETIRINRTKMYNLSYACVLIPRLPKHTLTGDLGRRMAEWLQTIHLAFGWRLAHLAVRPSYLMWVSDVLPKTSAASLIKTVRRQTSGWIFLEFPLMAKDNPSGAFWAPGYMAVTTGQLPTADELQVYIQNTRSRQGIAVER
jgi:DNA-binding response OmpR family regulator/REP element-mobilizing transposase RayT